MNTFNIESINILIPRSMKSTFTTIRVKFGRTFHIITRLIKSNPPSLEDMKEFLEDCDSSMKSSLAHCENISDILNVVHAKCTPTDISYLETLVTKFNIEEAKTHIESYKETIDQFCQTVSVRLCLEEIFPVTATPLSFKFETAIFVLDWDADDHELNDMRELLSIVIERLCIHVGVKVVTHEVGLITSHLLINMLLIDTADGDPVHTTKGTVRNRRNQKL